MMEPEVLAEMAAMRLRDEFNAMNRDYAELCWSVYDKFLRVGFDEDQAMSLTHRRLDRIEGWDCPHD